MDIIISNNIQWSDTSQNIEEHKVLVNEWVNLQLEMVVNQI